MCKGTLNIYDSPKDLAKCFSPELRSMKHDRSTFRLEEHEDHVTFHVEAKDATAFRATLNSISKLITVYERMQSVP